jgi:RNA polymerase sigma-70 factor (ECF subfamily)
VPARDELDALIGRAQGGDVVAFEALAAAHLGLVRRFARAFAPSEADADDLAQDALIKVYKSLRLFRYQAAFSTWLYAVVRNVFLDVAKSRAVRERAAEEPMHGQEVEGIAGEGAPDELLAQAQDRQRIWSALREVPVEFRTALVLFDIEGHSYDEVAAIEKVAVGTVKSRLSRGRAHLRRLLCPGEEEEAPAPPEPDRAGTSQAHLSSHLKRSGS